MKGKCGMLNAECGGGVAAFTLSPRASQRSNPSVQHSSFSIRPPRPAVTLIELLITMAIMAIISAAILGTASAAMESARRSRTQTLVTKIHGLVTERLASYETRRIDLLQGIVNAVNTTSPANLRGAVMADMRLIGLRELVKFEMPNRWSDFLPPTPSTPTETLVLSAKPSLAQTYQRRYFAVGASGASDEFEAAECLYMTVMLATGDGEARTLFAKQDIGDVDEDGMPEFIDGWGQPISWVRWPAGFVSDLQPADAAGNRLADEDHDPFDVYRRDQVGTIHFSPTGLPAAAATELTAMGSRNSSGNVNASAYRLTPLIYSSGPDGGSDIWATPIVNPSASDPKLDPYHLTAGNYLGVTTGPQAKDNITSHLNEY